jgi:glycosyltransferase A (GT-A) superfamily protein (DUF2064 family)
MSKFLPTLLTEKDWESENLLMDTILDLKNLDSKYYLLKTLSDVETADDLNRLSRFQQKDNEWF